MVFPGHEGLLNRPVGWSAGGFYMTPMSHGLRAAGTVELGGLSDRKRQASLDHITRHARKLLPDLPDTPAETWLGLPADHAGFPACDRPLGAHA